MTKNILMTIMMALAVVAHAGTFETEDLFSITLPEGWVRMPDDVLLQYAEAVSESDDEALPVYDYGFQLKSSEEWLSYPCVLVQVNYFGRFSTGDLERFARDSEGGIVDMNGNKTLFIGVQEQDGVKVLVGRQLTEYGYIELNGFATSDNFSEIEGVFREAFTNLKIDERIQYKPRMTDNAPTIGEINVGKVVVYSIQAALVGGLLWGIYGLVRNSIKRSLKRA